MHLNSEWRTLINRESHLLVNFHDSQAGCTPVVNISNVLNIRKVEKYSTSQKLTHLLIQEFFCIFTIFYIVE